MPEVLINDHGFYWPQGGLSMFLNAAMSQGWQKIPKDDFQIGHLGIALKSSLRKSKTFSSITDDILKQEANTPLLRRIKLIASHNSGPISVMNEPCIPKSFSPQPLPLFQSSLLSMDVALALQSFAEEGKCSMQEDCDVPETTFADLIGTESVMSTGTSDFEGTEDIKSASPSEKNESNSCMNESFASGLQSSCLVVSSRTLFLLPPV